MKDWVSLEKKICPVCYEAHGVGILLDKRVMKTLEPSTVTGWGLCPEHQKMHEDGYIALVETSNTPPRNGGVIHSNDARPTGVIVHIKREFFDAISDGTVKSDHPVIYCNADAIKKVTDIYNKLRAETVEVSNGTEAAQGSTDGATAG